MLKTFVIICELFFLILLTRCNTPEISEGSTDNNSIIQIDISENGNISNEFVNQLSIQSFTHLETNKESVFSDLAKASIGNDKLFVFSRNSQEIFLFNITNGSFLGKLSKRGKGPGEYIDLRDFQIYKDNLIAVLTYKKINYYDLDFNLIRTYDLGISNSREIYINPSYFHEENNLYYLWNGTIAYQYVKDRLPFLMYTSSKSEILKGYFPVTHKVPSNLRFSESENNVLINPILGSNLIYKINNNTIDACYRIDFGKNNLPEGILKKSDNPQLAPELLHSNYCYNIGNVFETTNYLYFQFTQRGIIMQGLYSKKSQQCKIGKMLPITKIECTDGDFLVALIQPMQLNDIINNLDKINLRSDIKELFFKIEYSNYDNPILCKFFINPF